MLLPNPLQRQLDIGRKPARSLQSQPCRVPVAKRSFRPASSAHDDVTTQSPTDPRDISIALRTAAASVLGGGLLAGAGCGLDEALPQGVQHLSATLGWGYFAVWSLSFYPQVRVCTRLAKQWLQGQPG